MTTERLLRRGVYKISWRFAALVLCVVGCWAPASKSVVEIEMPPDSAPSSTTERLTVLTIGDPAPPLRLGEFLKGEPFATFELGKVHVVEFSATWCGPCRAVIPHLTELQAKYPDVTFLSVYVREEDRDAPQPYIEQLGDRIGYRVAVDDVPIGEPPEAGAMYRTWMKPAEEIAIPTAFIINGDGHIAAITHPAIMDEALEKIVNGHWNLQKAAETHRNSVRKDRQQRAFSKRLSEILEATPSPEMLARLNELKESYPKDKHPEQAFEISISAFRRFVSPDGNDAMALNATDDVLEFLQTYPPESHPGIHNALAWEIVDPQRTQLASEPLLQHALKHARRADDLSDEADCQIADTLARALHLLGNSRLAFQTQRRAVRLLLDSPDADPKIVAELKNRLREYAAANGLGAFDETRH